MKERARLGNLRITYHGDAEVPYFIGSYEGASPFVHSEANASATAGALSQEQAGSKPLKPSESHFLDLRGLRYHCRTWGDRDAPKLFALHGWMDVSASFQFVVDELKQRWFVVAPDWRGFGLTGWTAGDSYWFADYYGDLDAILTHFAGQEPVNLLGHSMGGNVACIYAGVRTARVARLINVEGFGMRPTAPDLAPERLERWLNELNEPMRMRDYESYDALAARLRRDNPRLSDERARFLAQHWGQEIDDQGGGARRVALRGDPSHKRVSPILYRMEEAQACWRNVQAPVLWIEGAQSDTSGKIALTREQISARLAHFRTLESVVIDDAGHMIHHDQPERLAQAIETFLLRR